MTDTATQDTLAQRLKQVPGLRQLMLRGVPPACRRGRAGRSDDWAGEGTGDPTRGVGQPPMEPPTGAGQPTSTDGSGSACKTATLLVARVRAT